MSPAEAETSTRVPSKLAWRNELRRQALIHGAAAGLLSLTSFLGPWDPAGGSAIELWWLFEMLRTLRPAFAILALVGLLCALLARASWRIAAASLALSLLLTLPLANFSWHRPPLEEPSRLRLASANLLFINHETRELIQGLRDFDPDLILLQEVTDPWKAAFEAELGERYPHALWAPRSDAFGAAILSKIPFQQTELRVLGANALPMPRVQIKLASGAICTVYNCHLLPPRSKSYTAEQRASLIELFAQLQKENGPVLLGGDFNATEHSAIHRAILAEGFVDAFDQAGFGRGATWPARGLSALLPGIRLDHIYLRGLSASDCQVSAAGGSDHRSLLATVGR